MAPGGKLENDEREEKRAQTVDVLIYVQLLLDNAHTVTGEKETSLTMRRKSKRP